MWSMVLAKDVSNQGVSIVFEFDPNVSVLTSVVVEILLIPLQVSCPLSWDF